MALPQIEEVLVARLGENVCAKPLTSSVGGSQITVGVDLGYFHRLWESEDIVSELEGRVDYRTIVWTLCEGGLLLCCPGDGARLE